jgi:hypothetical protein
MRRGDVFDGERWKNEAKEERTWIEDRGAAGAVSGERKKKRSCVYDNVCVGRVLGVEATHREMFHRVRENLGPPGRDRRIAVLAERPRPDVDLEATSHRIRNLALGKDVEEHRKAVLDEAPAETERIHEARGEHGGVPCVTKAQGPLESGEQFKTEGRRS